MIQPNLPHNAGPVDWIGPDSYFFGISGLIHNVRLPTEASGSHLAPAVVMVHGWGGDESVMWVFKNVVPPNAAIITPRAPIDLDGNGYIWFERDDVGQPRTASHEIAIAKFEHFVSTLHELYPINPEHIVLIGFSQGGAMCNTLALTRPELVSGVASLGSFVPPFPENQGMVSSVNQMPVFIAHGTKDDIVPLAAAHRTREIYGERDAIITYDEYEVGHKMSSQGIKDLKAWVSILTK